MKKKNRIEYMFPYRIEWLVYFKPIYNNESTENVLTCCVHQKLKKKNYVQANVQLYN